MNEVEKKMAKKMAIFVGVKMAVHAVIFFVARAALKAAEKTSRPD